MSKKRFLTEYYIKYKFTVLVKNGMQLPQCIVCQSLLSNDTTRPASLEWHLTTNHVVSKEKPKEFFVEKLYSFKHMKLDSPGAFHQDTKQILEAS